MKYSYEVVKSKDGYDILCVNANDKKIFTSSKYNTKREISKLVEEVKSNINSPVIFIYGLSNGEYLKDLIGIGLRGHVYIIDYFEDLVEKYKKECENENIHFMTFEDIEKENIDVVDADGTTIFYGNCFNIYKNEISKCQEKIKKILVNLQINKNTIEHFSSKWIENALNNIPYIEEAHFINEYKNIYKGKPGIIVSAGPSLQNVLPLLKKYEDNFIIITGGRTLTTLKKHNIKVDFTCVVDAGKPSYDVIKEGLDYKTNLVFCDITNSKILNEYKGEKTYFASREFYKVIEEIIENMPDALNSGGSSVAHMCTVFAEYIGCSSIVFIGQDMAFTGDKCHADDAYVKKVDSGNLDKQHILVENVYGEKVKTDLVLDMFRQQMEKIIDLYNENKDKKIEFINSSSGGAKINGASFKEFSEVVKIFNSKIEKNLDIMNIQNKVDNKKVYIKMKNLLEEVLSVKELCKKSISYNRDLKKYHNKNTSRFNETMKKLDDIDKKVKKKTTGTSLIWSMVYGESEKIIKNHKRHDLKDEKEILNLVVEEGIAINTAIYDSLDKIVPIIKDVINKLYK